MKPFLVALILSGTFVALPVTSLLAQQPRQRDLTPFERCKPIATIASASNRETLTQLQAVLTARGYTIASIEWDRGELSAIRKDSPSSDKSDRVLLWLERDPVKPTERAFIYMLYGRFEPFFGSTEGPVRVRMVWADELGRMTTLQDAVVAFALSRL
jgi:hypothetical protein